MRVYPRTYVAAACTLTLAVALGGSPSAFASSGTAQPVPQQSGPFWPGNLLSMDNADFENGAGDWNAISNASTPTTDSTAYLHNNALKIVASCATCTSPFTSTLQLTGSSGIQIDLPGLGMSPTFRVGAYVKMPATSGHTTEFDLDCFDSNGNPIRWVTGSPVSNNSTGAWQWVEDDIQVPPNCAQVQGSPRVQFTGMNSGDTIHMDEAWFAPDRAALMIGAYAPVALAWQDVNTPGYRTYIGPLQSVKVFFGGNSPPLPGQWMVSGSQGNTCFEITQPPHPPAQPPACVINLNPPSTPSGPVYSEAQIQDFFNGLPADQTVIMVYRGEPEGKTDFSGCTGSTDAAKFVSCFEQESSNIRAAAAYWGRTENVFTADDSGSYEYDTPDSDSTDKTAGMSPAPCGWIAPPSYTDFYLLDHYEHGWADGSPLSAQNGDTTHDGQQQWNNWLGCVNGSGKPIGLAEYGLCSGGKFCGPQKTCGTSASTQLDHDTMEADRLYLEGEPSGRSPTLLWEYWYDNCWKFDSSNNMQTEWKDIENQNGGAVGG